MNRNRLPRPKVLSPRVRLARGIIFILAALLVLLGAASIPYVFESSTIHYQLGSAKTLLRTGKVLGMLAGSLLLMQLFMSGRLKPLDRIFSLNQLLVVHRINAVLVAILALLHPLFVFATTDISIIAVKTEHLPEILGGFLLLLIWFLMASGTWGLFLDLSFDRWWIVHRAGTSAAVSALACHVLSVSDTFDYGLPRTTVFAALGFYVLVLARVKIKPFLKKKRRYRVTSVAPVGKDAYAIELKGHSDRVLDYLPGQFAFLSFQSARLSNEEHPFSICSTPTRPSSLQFNIRCIGDWASQIGRLQQDDQVIIDGPYGLFTYLALADRQELVMIAGGIGITPMLSMLRYMADFGDERSITLVWSNRTREDILFPDEFKTLETRLKGLRIIHVLTREPGYGAKKGRMNQAKLAEPLSGCSRECAIFVCGPPRMMEEIRKALEHIGFSPRSIHMEEFRL